MIENNQTLDDNGDFGSHHKSTKRTSEKQVPEILYRAQADPDAVAKEIGDVLTVFDNIIADSVVEVNTRADNDPYRYRQPGMYSMDLNSTIKARIHGRLLEDAEFRSSVKLRKYYGRDYYLLKDRFELHIKRLYGPDNRPRSFPTPSNVRLTNQILFMGFLPIPMLFMGPKLFPDHIGTYVTSLISRKEINWSFSIEELFDLVAIANEPAKSVESGKMMPNLRIKDDANRERKKSSGRS